MKWQHSVVTTLSTSRIIFALLIIILATQYNWWLIFMCALIGFTTDYFDGALARRWRVTSQFGSFFDPLTDKILCLAIIGVIARILNPYFWIIFIIFSLYDITTTTLRLKNWHVKSIPAHTVAKYKTALQMTSLLLILSSQIMAYFPLLIIGTFLLCIAACLTTYSLLLYIKND